MDRLALSVAFSASVAGGRGILALNRFPPPPLVLPNRLFWVGWVAGGCDIAVLASWVLIALVGEFAFPKTFAVRCLSRLMSAFTWASLAAFSLYFLTPSRMCPMSTSLRACTNAVQLG